MTVFYLSLRAVEDVASSLCVTPILESQVAQVGCSVVSCVQVVGSPTPAPTPAVQPERRIAAPRKP